MNMGAIMASAAALARTVSEATQYGGVVGDLVTLGEKVIDVIDTIKQDRPTQDLDLAQREMIAAREQLAARVKAHAAATSSDLRKKSE